MGNKLNCGNRPNHQDENMNFEKNKIARKSKSDKIMFSTSVKDLDIVSDSSDDKISPCDERMDVFNAKFKRNPILDNRRKKSLAKAKKQKISNI